jgi:hypothetical protein
MGKEVRPRTTHLQSRIDTWSRIDPMHRLAHAISFDHSQIPSVHHCNSSNYTSNTRSNKQDVGLYPPGGRTWLNSCAPLFLSEAIESAKCPHTLHESKALNMGIARLEPRQLLFHNKIQQSRFDLIKICLGSRWRNRSADKIILFLVLVKSHNLVFSGVPILAKLKADK